MTLLSAARCPACGDELGVGLDPEPIRCGGCGRNYPRVDGIPVLLPQPEQHLSLWRRQLDLLVKSGERTRTALLEAAQHRELLEATRDRLGELAEAVQDQVDDVARILKPALGGAEAAEGDGLPRGVVEYIGYHYRDWGWPSVGYFEDEKPLAELTRLLADRPLGRCLVLGAGACGLAYQLHLRAKARETVALDIDPYLLVIGSRVARGESIDLTEASQKWTEASQISRKWTLKAGLRALTQHEFRPLFADGVDPPFADESFDSVVTPWFIDQVPRDLPTFFGRLRKLLKPSGIWLNQGPLVYPQRTPFEKRYAREELFELVRQAGLTLGEWSCGSQPYLVSPLSGNGKIESVLSFVASTRSYRSSPRLG